MSTVCTISVENLALRLLNQSNQKAREIALRARLTLDLGSNTKMYGGRTGFT